MRYVIKVFLKDTSGATAIEYGLIAALVCVAIIGALESFSTQNARIWNDVATSVSDSVQDARDAQS